MSKNEETESPPIILNETNKVIEMLEICENKKKQLTSLLDHKQSYSEQIHQHKIDENESVARRRDQMSMINKRFNSVDMRNTSFRDQAKRINDSCNEAWQYISDMESDFVECESKFTTLDNTSINDTTFTLYEKKVDELIKLLDQLTEKRHKKLESMKIQEKSLLEEGFNLKRDISAFENKELYFESYDADSELEMLENELKELQSRLSILGDEKSEMINENCQNASEGIHEKYHEKNVLELESESVKINNEISEIALNLEKQRGIESELPDQTLTLEGYVTKLNKEIQETSKFWDDLDQNQFEGVSQLEQEISKIKADIICRTEKYREARNIAEDSVEQMKQKDEEILATSPVVSQLSAKENELNNLLDNLETSTCITEKYDITLEKICKEKEILNEASVNIQNVIEKTVTQLTKENDKSEAEILTILNNNLIEIKQFEKSCTVVESGKTSLEEKAKHVENIVKELEEKRNNLKGKEAQTVAKQNILDTVIQEQDMTLKMIKTQKEELKRNLDRVPAPQPIYVTANDANFAKPKIKEISKKKAPEQLGPVGKRNWDSDSSMGTEEKINLSDFLKKKYRKTNSKKGSSIQRPDAENRK